MPWFSAGPPHCGGVESASGDNSQDEMEEQRGRREMGRTEAAGASVLVEDEGRLEQRALGLLARGVDVQLALQNVVDDRLGQVIHDMAVPMLQGQPG